MDQEGKVTTDIVAMLAGPFGGIMGFAMFVAAGGGFKFAKATQLAVFEERIEGLKEDMKREREECNKRLEELNKRVEKWEELALEGVARQMRQLHDSGVRILEDRRDA